MDKEELIKILNNDYIEIESLSICATYDEFKSLKEQGFNVHWMGEEYKEDENKGIKLFTITVEE